MDLFERRRSLLAGKKNYKTRLLCHAEDFTDSSNYKHILTNNNVTLNTQYKKFGNSSFHFSGSNNLQVTPSKTFNFKNGDWTFDAWVYLRRQNNDSFFFSGATTGSLFIGLNVSDGYLNFGIGRAGIAWDNTYSLGIRNTSYLNNSSQWYHLAVVKSSNKVYFFVNGQLKSTQDNVQSYSMLNGECDIGSQGSAYYFNGYIDELRISNVARWTSNFSVPTTAYTDVD